MTMIIAIAAATLTCVGSGITIHKGEPLTESRSGNKWVDDFNNRHDGFTAETRLEDGDELRLTMPRALNEFPGYIAMVRISDAGGIVRASKTMGLVQYTATYDRNRSTLVIATPDGAYSARCTAMVPANP